MLDRLPRSAMLGDTGPHVMIFRDRASESAMLDRLTQERNALAGPPCYPPSGWDLPRTARDAWYPLRTSRPRIPLR